MGSLSLASIETQARGQALRLASACHAPNRVVLPHPTGATMRVSAPLMAAFICCVSRGRITMLRRAGGTEIFVVSRWSDGALATEEGGVAAGGSGGRSVSDNCGRVALSVESEVAAS